MNDPTPPSGDRKPRRRAPRKRAPAPRVAKPEGDAPATPAAAEPANAETVARDAGTPAPTPAAAKRPSRAKKARRGGGRKQDETGDAVASSSAMDQATGPAEEAAVAPERVAAVEAAVRAEAPAASAPASAPVPAPAPAPAPVPVPTLPEAPSAIASPPPAGDSSPHAPPTTPASAAADTAPAARAEHPAATDANTSPQASAPPAAEDLTPPSLRPGELIRVPLSVRWRDLDAFNHVNNSKYLSYLEEARLRWMLTMPGMGLDENVAPVVAASNLNYRRPIGWPGEVVVELFVERLGNSSVTIGHRIVDVTEGGVTYCDGNVVMVWIDQSSGRAAPLPAAVRAACSRR